MQRDSESNLCRAPLIAKRRRGEAMPRQDLHIWRSVELNGSE